MLQVSFLPFDTEDEVEPSFGDSEADNDPPEVSSRQSLTLDDRPDKEGQTASWIAALDDPNGPEENLCTSEREPGQQTESMDLESSIGHSNGGRDDTETIGSTKGIVPDVREDTERPIVSSMHSLPPPVTEIVTHVKTRAEMEAKLRTIIDDRIEKLVLLLGIPHTVEELRAVVKETFGIYYDFSLQYMDSGFEDYFTLNKCDQIKHEDESLGSTSGQPSTDCASNAEPSGESSSSQDTIILSRRSSTE
ncbi:hypothetical protein SRHO_G00032820 [Serrasalmus rhombeus]